MRIILPKNIKVKTDDEDGAAVTTGKRPNPKGAETSGKVSYSAYDNSDYIEEIYARQLEQARSKLRRAYDNAVLGIDGALSKVGPVYQDARNQSASASALDGQNFAEYANAKGLNNGAQAQGELARRVTLQGALGDINAEEAGAVSDLELARMKAKNDYEFALASASAENAEDLAAALYDESVRAQKAYDTALAEQAKRAQENSDRIMEWQYKFEQPETAKADAGKATAAAEKSGSGGTAKTKASSGGKSSSGGGYDKLFADMEASGSAFTYLTANHSKYGVTSGAAATMDRIYTEYEAWLEKTSAERENGNYAADALGNYNRIVTGLAKGAAKTGETPLEYIGKVEKTHGKDFYINLIGADLYAKLRREASGFAAAYQQMINSADPAKWLKQNGGNLSYEVRQWLEDMLR
jgi:hypothetical protein